MNYKKVLSAVMVFIMLLSVCTSITAYADTENQSVGEQISAATAESSRIPPHMSCSFHRLQHTHTTAEEFHATVTVCG